MNKSEKSFINDFENEFSLSINDELRNKTILLAVSGGADSMAMLKCCIELIPRYHWQLFVVTINHRIRSEKQSRGDADFVNEFCKKNNIECKIVDAEYGQIKKISIIRNKGIEEAARFFRYNQFEEVAKKIKANAIFLAHNQNDQLETIFQRFIQGTYGSGSCGIPVKRALFFRPLLTISRERILKYLKIYKMKFRTDKTNNDNKYYRNKIRNKIFPYLSKFFTGWQTSVIHGIEKRKLDEDYFEQIINQYKWDFEDDKYFMEKYTFDSLQLNIKIRLVYKVLAQLEADDRFPYDFIMQFCKGNNVSALGLQMCYKNDKVIINKVKKCSTEQVFFAIIEEVGIYTFNKGKIVISTKLEKGMKEISIPCSIEYIDSRFVINSIPSKKMKKAYYLFEKEDF